MLEFRDLLADALEYHGVDFTRDGSQGENMPLQFAIKCAKQAGLALEFHCNAFSKPTASGVETLSASHHRPLCAEICAVVAEVLEIPNRGPKGEASGQHSRLGFISRGGGIIVELFFISNPRDLAQYQVFKHQLAGRLAELLVKHTEADV